jgi:hypothetical protein
MTKLLEEKLKLVSALDKKAIEICDVNNICNDIEESDGLLSRVLTIGYTMSHK